MKCPFASRRRARAAFERRRDLAMLFLFAETLPPTCFSVKGVARLRALLFLRITTERRFFRFGCGLSGPSLKAFILSA
jgi:hypothetical protein